MALDVRAVTDEAGFDALGPAWERLSVEGAGDALFGSFVWNRLWWKHYRHQGELRLLVAQDGADVVGVWPLFLARRNFHDVEIDMIGPRRLPRQRRDLLRLSRAARQTRRRGAGDRRAGRPSGGAARLASA